jgi:hypothetical protein
MIILLNVLISKCKYVYSVYVYTTSIIMLFTCILQERRALTINLVAPFSGYISHMTSQGLSKIK